jgi:TetR/AcrR family transcriptional regulator, repressor for neighboring sulfatase
MSGDVERGRGREATTAAILEAAEELFSADGFEAVTVRAIAARAGVSHALVHRYLGSKDDVFRAILSRNQGVMLAAAPDNPDLLPTTSLIMREGLTNHRRYVRLLADSALHGLPYAQTTGRFAAVERLVELAERAVASAPSSERTGKDLDPRFVIACVTALFLGWAATESWVLPAAGLHDMDEAEAIDGLERVMLGILRDNLPGLDSGASAAP